MLDKILLFSVIVCTGLSLSYFVYSSVQSIVKLGLGAVIIDPKLR